MFEGFETRTIGVPGARIHTRAALDDGPPVLLLHGYPQTHALWHEVAPRLRAAGRSVVVADLRGYGDSEPEQNDFTFRAMAADQVAVMRRLGIDRFDVVGHDRGARVAHRMVFDHPDRVRSVALLDILPTLDVWRTMDDWLGLRYYHWLFLAQPDGLPERMIGHDPIAYLHSALGGLSRPGAPGGLEIFAPAALAEYERAARKRDVVRAWCADYRAAAHEDVAHDRSDEGRTSDIPCLVVWGRHGVVGARVDPLRAWRRRFRNATGGPIDAGHYLVDERGEDIALMVLAHLQAADSIG